MKRPHTLRNGLLLLVLVFILVEYVVFTWVIPRYVIQVIQQAAGGELLVDGVRLTFPLTTTLTRLQFAHNTSDAALSIQRAVITPHWLSLPSRTLWIDTLQLERPMLRLTRTKDGTVRWPDVSELVAARGSRPRGVVRTHMERLVSSLWRVRVNTLKVTDGTIEIIDERAASPFHGVVDHVSLVIGPLTNSPRMPPVSFAASGQFAGDHGHAAPLYCSGWLGTMQHNLEASCQLEPLTLAAFESYYQSSLRIRVNEMTLKSTSNWTATHNRLEARIQLELGNIHPGDLTIRKRAFLAQVTSTLVSESPRLQGEITLTGPLDDPARWHATFTPGDTKVRQLVERLLERGIEVVRLPFGVERVGISISGASEAMMHGIETISAQVREALDVLVPAPSVPVLAPVESAPPETPAATSQEPAPAAIQPAAASSGVSSPPLDTPSTSPKAVSVPPQ